MLSPSGMYLRKNARVKYQAILKAACRLFLKHGYTRTNMDQIAAEAGVSKQTVYSYFTNKDRLFCKMVEAECERHSPSEHVLAKASLDPSEALFRFGQGIIDMIASQRGIAIHKLVVAEADRHPRIARLYYESGPQSMKSALRDYLSKQAAAKLLEIDDMETACDNFFSMIKGPFQMRLQLRMKPLPTKKDTERHIRHTVRVFYKIYGTQQG